MIVISRFWPEQVQIAMKNIENMEGAESNLNILLPLIRTNPVSDDKQESPPQKYHHLRRIGCGKPFVILPVVCQGIRDRCVLSDRPRT